MDDRRMNKDFPPVRDVSGLDNRTISPEVKRKILIAAAETHSYDRAEQVLLSLAGIAFSSRQINRITDESGRQFTKRPPRGSAPDEYSDGVVCERDELPREGE